MSTRASSAARRLACLVFVLWTLLVALSFPPVYADDDGSSPGGSSSGEDGGSSSATASSQRTSSSNENDEEADWGSFYDPNNVFCGQHDCYKILGFDFLNWGSDPPSLKDITKSYRSLSRRWHPDKNKAKGAREKFVVSFHALKPGTGHSCLLRLVSVSPIQIEIKIPRRSPRRTRSSRTLKSVVSTTTSVIVPTITSKSTARPSCGHTHPSQTRRSSSFFS